jgi:hypothetical protein
MRTGISAVVLTGSYARCISVYEQNASLSGKSERCLSIRHNQDRGGTSRTVPLCLSGIEPFLPLPSWHGERQGDWADPEVKYQHDFIFVPPASQEEDLGLFIGTHVHPVFV